MTKRKKLKINSVPAAIMISLSISLLSSVLIILLSAFLIVKNDFSHDNLKYFWIAIFAIGGITGGLSAGRLFKSRGLLWGSAIALFMSIILFIIIAAVNGLNIDYRCLLLSIVSVFAGGVGGIISSNL